MENFVQQSTCEQVETSMSGSKASATPETSKSHTAFLECLSSMDKVALGDVSGASSSSIVGRSEYFSARTEAMMHSKSQFSSNVEYEIEHSKVHWSEVSGLADLSEEDDEEEVNRENWKLFEELMNDPQWTHPNNPEFGAFFRDSRGVVNLGRKIAEGGQAEIFEFLTTHGIIGSVALLKVFKRGSRFSQLQQQWPLGVLRREVIPCLFCGTMLDDGRFAFVMLKCRGDLRKLIDQAMQEKNNKGPPFPYEWKGKTLHAEIIMWQISVHMSELHDKGILHSDLKASNILLDMDLKNSKLWVADFECSIGVQGTGFWRAPEILLALKNKVAIDFTEKMDVYSYGMTCFEIVSGRLPFESELELGRDSHDLIIGGKRPKLPSDLDVRVKDLIQKCWDPNPTLRPTFLELREMLLESFESLHKSTLA